MLYAKPFAKLVEELNKMPGIGPKSAQRLALYILRLPEEEAERIREAIKVVKEKMTYCSVCFNITDNNLCSVCEDERRDHSLVCVVEEARDILALEKSGEYKGIYHVLQGALNPLEGINPEDLRIKELLMRIKKEEIKEIILATNPNLEGEATAMYLAKLIKPSGVKVSRIAHGLPVGSSLDYADEVTLIKAMEGRREM